MQYSDDHLRDQLAQAPLESVQQIVQTLRRFRWILILQKSAVESSHCLEYLGLVLDPFPRFFLPVDKLQSLSTPRFGLYSPGTNHLLLHESSGLEIGLF